MKPPAFRASPQLDPLRILELIAKRGEVIVVVDLPEDGMPAAWSELLPKAEGKNRAWPRMRVLGVAKARSQLIELLQESAAPQKPRRKTLYVEMSLFDNGDVPVRGGRFLDRVELSWGAEEIDGKPKLMLTLVAGKSRVTFEGTDPGGLFECPVAELRLKLGQ